MRGSARELTRYLHDRQSFRRATDSQLLCHRNGLRLIVPETQKNTMPEQRCSTFLCGYRGNLSSKHAETLGDQSTLLLPSMAT